MDVRVRLPGVEGRLRLRAGGAEEAAERLAAATGLRRECFELVCADWAEQPVLAEVRLRAPGGKGGYGTRLKNEARQKMRFADNSACRTLDGRRVADVQAEQRIRQMIAKPHKPDPAPPKAAVRAAAPAGPALSFRASILAGLQQRQCAPRPANNV